jgi:hypothetical protein
VSRSIGHGRAADEDPDRLLVLARGILPVLAGALPGLPWRDGFLGLEGDCFAIAGSWYHVQPYLEGHDGQLAAVADVDWYLAGLLLRPCERWFPFANPYADFADLRPQPVLAEGAELNEGEGEGQATEDSADCCDGRGPVHGVTV